MLLSWFQQIDAAQSPVDVVAVTRDYLATWTPDELGLLPAQCRPGRVKDVLDIEQLHVNLVEEYGRNRLSGEALSSLQRMTSFIVRASVRIAHLRTEDETPSDHRDDDRPPSGNQRSAASRQR